MARSKASDDIAYAVAAITGSFIVLFIATTHVVPPNSVGIFQCYRGISEKPPGTYVLVPPRCWVRDIVVAPDTDMRSNLRCKTGDHHVINFPAIAVDNEIVGNYTRLFISHFLDKRDVESPGARRSDPHVPEESMIFRYIQPILNTKCHGMTGSKAVQLVTWDLLAEEIATELQKKVPNGVKINGLRMTALPQVVGNYSSVDSVVGSMLTGVHKRLYSYVGI